jgi:choice-of-anchor B domain-containing protein
MGFPRFAAACAALVLAVAVRSAAAHTPCVGGVADGYACSNIDLLAHLTLAQLGVDPGGNGNDMWGWTDPDTQKEYALVGLSNGTAFVDISDPENVVRLGNLPTHSVNSLWRDIKVYDHYALVVSEAQDHGLQIFDLYHLRDVTTPPVTFTEDAWYGEFGRAHNIVVDEASGFAYAVGSRQGTEQCSAGLHMIDMHDPLNPTFAGCFGDDGYTHDAECIVYDGPDTRYTGHEICFNANEDTLTIVDVTDKANPAMLSRTGYSGSGYTHQGWLTDDRRHMLVDDELDEVNFGHNTYTYVWNVQDLTQPQLEFHYTAAVPSIDHNLYIRDGYAFESNYKSGLRILSLADIDSGSLSEAAYFDTFPAGDDANFDGTWSNYPYYPSGVVAVSDMSGGLFVLQPNLCVAPAAVDGLVAQANGDHRIDLSWNASATDGATYAVDRTLGGCAGSVTETIASALADPSFSDTSASGQVTYGYRVRSVAASGQCSAAASACVEAQTTGTCTAAPAFAGISSAHSAGTPACAIDLGWNAAQTFCGGSGAQYNVYRSTDPAFAPDLDSLIAGGIDALAFEDATSAAGSDYTYVVRAVDTSNGSEDGNLARLTARASGPPTDGDWFSGAEVGDPLLSGNDTPQVRRVGPVPLHVAWEIVDDVAHSGSRSYYSSYNDLECLALGTDPIALSAGDIPSLDFWTRFGIETGWDGGVVQISTDGGTNWTTLTPAGGYPGTIQHTGNACSFAIGTGAYTGTDLNWREQSIDLAAYAGQTVEIRWLFGTDTAQTAEGWWIDDLRLHHAQVPGVCVAGDELIFANGFE